MVVIVIGAVGIVTKCLVQDLEELEKKTGWMETIQTAALLRLVRIMRWVLEN